MKLGSLNPSRSALLVVLAPNALMLFLYYSLVAWVRADLGAKPSMSPDELLPPLRHWKELALLYCWGLLLTSLIIVPTGILAGLVSDRWRKLAPWSAAYLAIHLLSWILMVSVPPGFFAWLLD